jgi:hypothetical protein
MPELTVMVPLGDREIEMRKPSDGSLVVLSRTFRGVSKIENVAEITDQMRDKLVRDLGMLGKIVESMIVKDDDKDWLDDVMIDGSVTPEDVFAMIKVAGEKFNGAAAPIRAAKAVRRK